VPTQPEAVKASDSVQGSIDSNSVHSDLSCSRQSSLGTKLEVAAGNGDNAPCSRRHSIIGDGSATPAALTPMPSISRTLSAECSCPGTPAIGDSSSSNNNINSGCFSTKGDSPFVSMPDSTAYSRQASSAVELAVGSAQLPCAPVVATAHTESSKRRSRLAPQQSSADGRRHCGASSSVANTTAGKMVQGWRI
jgi:hypothetical protein